MFTVTIYLPYINIRLKPGHPKIKLYVSDVAWSGRVQPVYRSNIFKMITATTKVTLHNIALDVKKISQNSSGVLLKSNAMKIDIHTISNPNIAAQTQPTFFSSFIRYPFCCLPSCQYRTVLGFTLIYLSLSNPHSSTILS